MDVDDVVALAKLDVQRFDTVIADASQAFVQQNRHGAGRVDVGSIDAQVAMFALEGDVEDIVELAQSNVVGERQCVVAIVRVQDWFQRQRNLGCRGVVSDWSSRLAEELDREGADAVDSQRLQVVELLALNWRAGFHSR